MLFYVSGKSEEERKIGQTSQVLKKQLKGCLFRITPGKLDYIAIAYEPIWAVGTDNIPTSDEILEAKIIIKKSLAELFSPKARKNEIALWRQREIALHRAKVCLDPAMDGALIGRESLMPHEFVKIAKMIEDNNFQLSIINVQSI